MRRQRLFGWGMLIGACICGGFGCGRNPQPPAAPAVSTAPAAPAVAALSTAKLKTMMTPVGVEMVCIAGGTFEMGSARGDEDERPVRKVTVGSFWMDRCEITQKVYQMLAGKNPSKHVGEDKPVDTVSWFDAVRFCNLRSLREGLKPCYDEKTLFCDVAADGFRLPTEAEWEYACRAGTTTAYAFGDNAAELARYGWFKEQSGQTTHAVATKLANAWGLFDMHGNVLEWCGDFYAEDAYVTGTIFENPTGPARGEECVMRGGSWSKPAGACRSSARASETPRLADACFGADNYGFRCVRKVVDGAK